MYNTSTLIFYISLIKFRSSPWFVAPHWYTDEWIDSPFISTGNEGRTEQVRNDDAMEGLGWYQNFRT